MKGLCFNTLTWLIAHNSVGFQAFIVPFFKEIKQRNSINKKTNRKEYTSRYPPLVCSIKESLLFYASFTYKFISLPYFKFFEKEYYEYLRVM